MMDYLKGYSSDLERSKNAYENEFYENLTPLKCDDHFLKSNPRRLLLSKDDLSYIPNSENCASNLNFESKMNIIEVEKNSHFLEYNVLNLWYQQYIVLPPWNFWPPWSHQHLNRIPLANFLCPPNRHRHLLCTARQKYRIHCKPIKSEISNMLSEQFCCLFRIRNVFSVSLLINRRLSLSYQDVNYEDFKDSIISSNNYTKDIFNSNNIVSHTSSIVSCSSTTAKNFYSQNLLSSTKLVFLHTEKDFLKNKLETGFLLTLSDELPLEMPFLNFYSSKTEELNSSISEQLLKENFPQCHLSYYSPEKCLHLICATDSMQISQQYQQISESNENEFNQSNFIEFINTKFDSPQKQKNMDYHLQFFPQSTFFLNNSVEDQCWNEMSHQLKSLYSYSQEINVLFTKLSNILTNFEDLESLFCKECENSVREDSPQQSQYIVEVYSAQLLSKSGRKIFEISINSDDDSYQAKELSSFPTELRELFDELQNLNLLIEYFISLSTNDISQHNSDLESIIMFDTKELLKAESNTLELNQMSLNLLKTEQIENCQFKMQIAPFRPLKSMDQYVVSDLLLKHPDKLKVRPFKWKFPSGMKELFNEWSFLEILIDHLVYLINALLSGRIPKLYLFSTEEHLSKLDNRRIQLDSSVRAFSFQPEKCSVEQLAIDCLYSPKSLNVYTVKNFFPVDIIHMVQYVMEEKQTVQILLSELNILFGESQSLEFLTEHLDHLRNDISSQNLCSNLITNEKSLLESKSNNNNNNNKSDILLSTQLNSKRISSQQMSIDDKDSKIANIGKIFNQSRKNQSLRILPAELNMLVNESQALELLKEYLIYLNDNIFKQILDLNLLTTRKPLSELNYTKEIESIHILYQYSNQLSSQIFLIELKELFEESLCLEFLVEYVYHIINITSSERILNLHIMDNKKHLLELVSELNDFSSSFYKQLEIPSFKEFSSMNLSCFFNLTDSFIVSDQLDEKQSLQIFPVELKALFNEWQCLDILIDYILLIKNDLKSVEKLNYDSLITKHTLESDYLSPGIKLDLSLNISSNRKSDSELLKYEQFSIGKMSINYLSKSMDSCIASYSSTYQHSEEKRSLLKFSTELKDLFDQSLALEVFIEYVLRLLKIDYFPAQILKWNSVGYAAFLFDDADSIDPNRETDLKFTTINLLKMLNVKFSANTSNDMSIASEINQSSISNSESESESFSSNSTTMNTIQDTVIIIESVNNSDISENNNFETTCKIFQSSEFSQSDDESSQSEESSIYDE